MNKKKKTEGGFFKAEIETDDIRVLSGNEVDNPDENLTGSFSLDYELVVPFPEGRIVEVYGPEGSMKTTLTLEVAGQALLAGKDVLYINMEKNLTRSLLDSIRTLRPFLNEDKPESERKFWIVNPTTGEQAFNTMRRFAEMHPGGLAILDSIDAAQPEAVLSGEIGENKIGNLSKLMSDGMRKLISPAEKNKVTLVFVNQMRQNIGVMYGNPNTTPGGNAVKYYASQRIELLKPAKAQIIVDESNGEKIGAWVRFKVIKNKLAPDGNDGQFPILFKNGIFREREVITQCLQFGILKFGGRGGKQVLLPILDEKGKVTEENLPIRQALAARRLLLDQKLYEYLVIQLQNFMQEDRSDAVDVFLEDDEVSDS